MKRFALNVEDKKILVNRLGELTGEKPRYTYMPRCAYECGPYTVEKNGDLLADDGADDSILQTLLDEGLVTGSLEAEEVEVADTEPAEDTSEETIQENMEDGVEENAEEPAETASAETASAETTEPAEDANKPDSLTISLPMAHHSVDSLRRLINLIYSRGPLLTKSTGGAFGCDRELVTALDEAGIVKMEELISMVTEHGGLTGLTFEDGKVNFTGFPMTDDPDRSKAFMQLASLMNKHAIEMKRIQAKEVNDENEKYAFRIWLLRIGMNSDEYKTTRKVLMQNLSGHTAFRTKAEEEKWKARQQAKRDELRAAKAAAQAETADENAEPAAAEA
jgi:hypothetical protein